MEILAYQTILIHGKPCPQLLVQWTGSPANEASLEQVISFQACYPDFHLKDNAIFDGERNNTSLSVGISESNSEKEAIKKTRLDEGLHASSEIPWLCRLYLIILCYFFFFILHKLLCKVKCYENNVRDIKYN